MILYNQAKQRRKQSMIEIRKSSALRTTWEELKTNIFDI
jgi:hypothetical protein